MGRGDVGDHVEFAEALAGGADLDQPPDGLGEELLAGAAGEDGALGVEVEEGAKRCSRVVTIFSISGATCSSVACWIGATVFLAAIWRWPQLAARVKFSRQAAA